MTKVIRLFPGHGSQYKGMFKELYEQNQVARDKFDIADSIYKSLTGESLIKIIFNNGDLSAPTIMQPAIFVADMVMNDVLNAKSIKFDAVLGHSLGELAALCSVGVFSFEDGIRIVYARAQSVTSVKHKNMWSFLLNNQEDLNWLLLKIQVFQSLNFSIVNSNRQFVISGSDTDFEKLTPLLEERELIYTKLPIGIPFHNPLLRASSDDYYNRIQDIRTNISTMPIYSTILDRYYTENDFSSSDHFKRILTSQLYKTMNFQNAIQSIISADNKNIIIECGPSNILSRLAKRNLKDVEKTILYTDSKKKNTIQCLKQLSENKNVSMQFLIN